VSVPCTGCGGARARLAQVRMGGGRVCVCVPVCSRGRVCRACVWVSAWGARPHLQCQLPGRGDHHGLDAPTAAVAPQALHDRDQKRQRLAAASLGLGDDVLAAQQRLKGARLHLG
jgi:hypothetical protein